MWDICVQDSLHANMFIISLTQATAKGFMLIQTKEVSMRPEDVKRVFQSNAEDLVEWITKGHFLFVVICVCCCSTISPK